MPRLASLLALLALAAVAAGCGETGEEKAFKGGDEAAREGIAVPMDEVAYNVFITRQLNPRDPEDRQYLVGEPEPPPGRTYYGVFIQVCNESDEVKQTSRTFTVVDARDNHFEPQKLSEDNVFAYKPEKLAAHECIPNEASATSYAPTGGQMLLYEVPVGATENRPFELEIEGEQNLVTGSRPIAKIELDL